VCNDYESLISVFEIFGSCGSIFKGSGLKLAGPQYRNVTGVADVAPQEDKDKAYHVKVK